MPDFDSLTYATRNRELWDKQSAEYQQKHGPQMAASGGAAWGVWQVPESELRALGDVNGKDVLELGCGAAQWSIALHQMGARITALDSSARQLHHARALMAAAGVSFPLVHSNAESTGLAGNSFDIVFCDHGAMTFTDPYRTVPEAARLLRAGGLLVFSDGHARLEPCLAPAYDHPSDRLTVNYWDLHFIKESGHATQFQLPYGTWIRLFCKWVCYRRPPPVAHQTPPAATATTPTASGRDAGRWSTSGASENRLINRF
jgi:SAM-dependent methyltransferase